MKRTGFIAGVGFLVCGGLLIYIFGFALPLPPEHSYPVWLPQNAEIRSSSLVKPGTFKIRIPLEEFKATTESGQRVIVVHSGGAGRGGLVEYWRPSPDGIFHYALDAKPSPSAFVVYEKVIFDEQNGKFVYTPVRSPLILLSGGVFVVIGVLLIRAWRVKS